MGKVRVMEWDCRRDGCFNERCRVKFEALRGILPGNCSFTDIDGIVEVGGRFLVLEWKGRVGPLPLGQRLLFERLTEDRRFLVVVVAGDARKMEVEWMMVVRGGCMGSWRRADLSDLRRCIREYYADAGVLW